MTGTGSSTTAVLTALDRTRAWQEAFYRHLHEHPELSHQEHATAAAVAERLRGLGFEVHDGIGGTGVPSGCCATATGRVCCCGPTWTRCR